MQLIDLGFLSSFSFENLAFPLVCLKCLIKQSLDLFSDFLKCSIKRPLDLSESGPSSQVGPTLAEEPVLFSLAELVRYSLPATVSVILAIFGLYIFGRVVVVVVCSPY